MKKILLIDNYDSFTFNLYHQLEKISDTQITVIRNDEINTHEPLNFDLIILSPGPKLPENAGNLMDIIKNYHQHKPIIGICLGMQGIAQFFGSKLENLTTPEHGQSKSMKVLNQLPLYRNCPDNFMVGRYHSWGIQLNDLNKEELIPLSIDENNWVMSFKHQSYKIIGIQFHPESILTEYRDIILQNAINYCIEEINLYNTFSFTKLGL